MSVCTPTAMANDPHRALAHSSWSTAEVRKSAPAPPYFSSYSTPRNPSSPMRRQRDFGMRPAASHSSTCGATSRSTKLRTVARNISCCASKMLTRGSHPFPVVEDLLRAVGDRPGGDDLDTAAELHDVADRGLERGRRRGGVGAGCQLGAERERVLVSLASDHDLAARDPGRARGHLVGLP